MADIRRNWKSNTYKTSGICLLTIACVTMSHAQTACPAPVAADFHVVDLTMTGLTTPTDMELAPDGRIFISDIYTGELKIFRDGGTPRLATAGKLSVANSNEHGLVCFALDPKFASNGWIYIRFSPKAGGEDEVARFKITGDVLDVNSKKTLLKIPKETNAHLGAGMAFDSHGNLLISTGCDTSPQSNSGYGAFDIRTPIKDGGRSAANTMDFRGKILRVTPIPFPDTQSPSPGIGSTYEIPTGNFWETIAATLPATDMKLVLKEIYAMGFRNPYRISVKPNTDWVYSAEVGPDAVADDNTRGRAGHDELNLTKPGGGFYGWPYCNGNNFPYNKVDYTGGGQVYLAEKWDCANPVNDSPNNKGITKLPPATAPIVWYAGNNKIDFKELGTGQETGMVGPFYQYNSALNSTVKFPPYYNGKMVFWDWSRFFHTMVSLDAQGGLAKIEDIPLTDHKWGSDIDIIFGANGAMYVLQWSTNGYSGGAKAFYKIEYSGPLNESVCPVPIAQIGSQPKGFSKQGRFVPVFMGESSFQLPAGALGADIFTWDGRKIGFYSRTGDVNLEERVVLPTSPGNQVVWIRVR
ncbi:MAG: PQQ-dependent sugar dehydrogenase [Fibrobacteria bacterium]